MKRTKIICSLWLMLALVLVGQGAPGFAPQDSAKKPLELADVLAWESVRAAVPSSDGAWLAYVISPAQGDSELVLTATRGEAEKRFAVGEGGGRPVFSDDAKWLAFTIAPTRKEKENKSKPQQNKAVLLDLETMKEIEFEQVRSFTFSGESVEWLAMNKYPAAGAAGRRGGDLDLYPLAGGNKLNFGNVAEFAFNKAGNRLAWVVDAANQNSNGIQLRQMKSGEIVSLENDKAVYSNLRWTDEGDALIALKGVDDENYKDKLYSIVGINVKRHDTVKKVFDPRVCDDFPEGMTIASNRAPQWTEDGNGFIFGIKEVEKTAKAKNKEEQDAEGEAKKDGAKKATLTAADKPDLVIWHWQDNRIQAQQQVQSGRDKTFNYLCLYWIAENNFVRLADDELRQVSLGPKQRWALGSDNREYELMSNLDGRRYNDVYVIDAHTGDKKLALTKARWSYGISPDDSHFLYYEKGDFYTYEMATGETYNITEGVPASFINTEDDHNVVDPPTRSLGWTKGGKEVLLSDAWDVWKVPVHGGKSANLTVNGKENEIRYRGLMQVDADRTDGIDLSKETYFTTYGEWTKKSGYARLVGGKKGVESVIWEDASIGGLQKPENSDSFFYTRQTLTEPSSTIIVDKKFDNARKLTSCNEQQKDYAWPSGSRLIDFTSDKGDRLQASLFLPGNYEEGKSYPTIIYMYEKLTSGHHRYPTPRANGFDKTVYTSNGYAVLMPDIVYKINDPGMSAVWCVLPALNAAIETGIVDGDNVGVHGHSWGGYQTAFLVTQTDAFGAAVAGAPLTNMISMYSSIYWNSGSVNQTIFESSQGRFYGGYWDNLDAYSRNSPVYYADKVETPLIILHNDKDGAVDWNQGIEYYNTLRRLRKPVIMLQYKGENHGLSKPANQRDYTFRMKEFFDHYLRGADAPPWLADGVDHLDHEEHIEESAQRVQAAIKKGEKTKKDEKK